MENLSHKCTSSGPYAKLILRINDTGVIGLLGSNEQASSTTMNIICGTLLQTEGDVSINGLNIKDDPIEYKKQIGFYRSRRLVSGLYGAGVPGVFRAAGVNGQRA